MRNLTGIWTLATRFLVVFHSHVTLFTHKNFYLEIFYFCVPVGVVGGWGFICTLSDWKCDSICQGDKLLLDISPRISKRFSLLQNVNGALVWLLVTGGWYTALIIPSPNQVFNVSCTEVNRTIIFFTFFRSSVLQWWKYSLMTVPPQSAGSDGSTHYKISDPFSFKISRVVKRYKSCPFTR